eukprot:12430402-Karenia_brevis.AAC.1
MKATRDPKKFEMIIGGDWNYISPGDARHYLGDPAAVFKGLNAKQVEEPIIQHQVGQLAELQQSRSTHYDHTQNSESRLDR